MAQSTQSYSSHRRYIPIYHFFVLPVLGLNILAALARLNKFRTPYKVWEVLVAVALAILANEARSMVVRAQDRSIRIEERNRLGALLPEDLRSRIDELTKEQLIGIRFASDDEVPELVRRCLGGELTTAEQVKKAVANWRPDHHRV